MAGSARSHHLDDLDVQAAFDEIVQLSIPRKLGFLLIFLCSSLVVSLRSPLEPILRTAGSPQGSEWCQCPPPFSVVVNRRDLELLDLKMLFVEFEHQNSESHQRLFQVRPAGSSS